MKDRSLLPNTSKQNQNLTKSEDKGASRSQVYRMWDKYANQNEAYQIKYKATILTSSQTALEDQSISRHFEPEFWLFLVRIVTRERNASEDDPQPDVAVILMISS